MPDRGELQDVRGIGRHTRGRAACRRHAADELLEPLRRDPAPLAPSCSTSTARSRPIVAQPDDAHMPETTRRPLIEVAERYGVVACVSGRRASDARRIVSLGSIAYVGNHGSEVLRPGAIEPEVDRELAGLDARACTAFARGLRRRAAPPARAARGQGGDRRAALARRARRGGRRGGGPRGRRARRGGRLHDALGPQGARDPPAGADRQGRGDRRRCCATPTSTPRSTWATTCTDLDAFRGLRELVERAGWSTALRVGVRSDEGPPELERGGRRRWSTGPTACARCCRRLLA